MSGIFHAGRWYESADMICRRCGGLFEDLEHFYFVEVPKNGE